MALLYMITYTIAWITSGWTHFHLVNSPTWKNRSGLNERRIFCFSIHSSTMGDLAFSPNITFWLIVTLRISNINSNTSIFERVSCWEPNWASVYMVWLLVIPRHLQGSPWKEAVQHRGPAGVNLSIWTGEPGVLAVAFWIFHKLPDPS